MRIRARHILFAALAVLALLLIAAPYAMAQIVPAPPDPPPNPNSAIVVAYASAGLAFMTAILSMFREDNPIVTGIFSPKTAAIFVAVGGVLEATALAVIHGTPWVIAILTGATSAIMAYVGAAKRVKPGASPQEAFEQKSGKPAALPKMPDDQQIPPPPPMPPGGF